MLHQPTIEKLLAMHLEPVVETWRSFEQDENAQQLTFEEKLSLMVDRLWTWRQNLALERRLRYAKLRGNACVEDLDYRASRGLDRTLMRSLANDSGWVQRHENLFILGPTGVGKSFLACALAQKACRDGHLVLYTRAAALFRDLTLARADGSLRNLLARLSRVEVLIVDDWAMAPMQETERRDFWEICDERYQMRSTILTSQLPVAQWHEQIGDATLADGILDRLVHNAHRIELRGESMRKTRAKKSEAKSET
jgi:DNA replication protein DnaC